MRKFLSLILTLVAFAPVPAAADAQVKIFALGSHSDSLALAGGVEYHPAENLTLSVVAKGLFQDSASPGGAFLVGWRDAIVERVFVHVQTGYGELDLFIDERDGNGFVGRFFAEIDLPDPLPVDVQGGVLWDAGFFPFAGFYLAP